jgi:hypothetical protein
MEKGKFIVWLIAVGVISYAMGMSFFASGWSPGPNYRNVTVDTKVNITGAMPVIQSIILSQPLTLNAGSTTFVQCNVSLLDYNGFADIDVVNATFYSTTVAAIGAEDNNTRYINTSCSAVSGQESGTLANYTCTFPVRYYALNGTWNCSVGVNDTVGLKTIAGNTTSVNALYALNITPTLLNYGDLAAGEYSNNLTANISNIGNLNINISVFGYGRNLSDNLSFVCDQGNFTANLQHFASNSTADYNTKQPLNATYQMVKGLTVNKTTNTSDSFNTTYWEFWANQTQVAFGNCTGFLVFQAGTAG